MTFDSYVSFMICVLMTCFTLVVVGFVMHCGWTILVEPIMDRVKEQKELVWKDKFYKEESRRMEAEKKLRTIGFDDDFIYCIDMRSIPRIVGEPTEEDALNGCVNVTVRFGLNAVEFGKLKARHARLFRMEVACDPNRS